MYLFVSKMLQVFPNKSLKERTGKKARKQSWAQTALTRDVRGRQGSGSPLHVSGDGPRGLHSGRSEGHVGPAGRTVLGS